MVQEKFKNRRCNSEFFFYTYDAIHSSECLMAVYVNFYKAFATVYHNILLRKLKHVIVRGRVFDWFRTYLTDRKQIVAVVFSTSKVIESRFTQGLNLGPSLLLVYLNDIVGRHKYYILYTLLTAPQFFLSHPSSYAFNAIFNEELY